MSEIAVDCACGCQVVFTAESNYHTSRMTACIVHGFRDGDDVRTMIVADARKRRDELLVQQN